MIQLLPSSCAVCGKLLLGAVHIDAWDNMYCPEHQSRYPLCSCCGRLICERLTGGGTGYSDGRLVCNLCRRTAVDTTAQSRPIVEAIARWFYSRGMRFGRMKLKVELVDAQALGNPEGYQAADPTHGYIMGMALQSWKHENGQKVRWVKGLKILAGLPQVSFEGVASHELGHAWLFLHEVDPLEPWEEEGFCNVLRYLWHRNHDSAEAAHWVKILMEDPDPVYGEGFRKVRDLLKPIGLPAALQYLDQHKRLPT